MVLLLSESEADCLAPQHSQNLYLIHSPPDRTPYRASGLVRRGIAAVDSTEFNSSNGSIALPSARNWRLVGTARLEGTSFSQIACP
jgi:hypothetical protein